MDFSSDIRGCLSFNKPARGVAGAAGCRRGPPFPQMFGGASSVVEQRTRLVAEAEAVKVEGPL